MIDAYHHGDLRRAVLDRAVQVIATDGPEALSLRALAADLGVSHTAPRHHFVSRQGLLTAVAVEGFRELGNRMSRVRDGGGPFLDVGVAYVEFALDRPAHFAVMFSPTVLDQTDPDLIAAMDTTFARLRQGVDELPAPAREDAAAAVIASWSLVHGLATLALNGNLDRAGVRALVADGDLLGLARRSAALLHRGPPTTTEEPAHVRS